MKKVFLTLSLVAIFCIAALAEKQVAVLYVPDMECNSCKAKVENILAFEKGVRKLDYDVEKHLVTVTFEDKKTNVETLQKTLVKYLNYKSEVVSVNGVESKDFNKDKECKTGKDKNSQSCKEGDHKGHNHDGKSEVKTDRPTCPHNHEGCSHVQGNNGDKKGSCPTKNESNGEKKTCPKQDEPLKAVTLPANME